MSFPEKIPKFLNSPKDVEIPNLGTNSPKVGTLRVTLEYHKPIHTTVGVAHNQSSTALLTLEYFVCLFLLR